MREIFVLFEVENQTLAEIAQMLDLPIGTVGSRLSRSRELFAVAPRKAQEEDERSAMKRLVESDPVMAALVAASNRRAPREDMASDILRAIGAVRPAPSPERRWWKPFAVVAVVALAGGGTVVASRPTAAPAVPPPRAEAAQPAQAAPAPSDTIPSISVEQLPTTSTATSTSTSTVTAALPPSAKPAPAPTADPADELLRIRQARAALARKDDAACLHTLARYHADFPSGQFTMEADMMAIEATAQSGDRAGAETLAQRFHARYPRSPYDARLRTLLSEGAPP